MPKRKRKNHGFFILNSVIVKEFIVPERSCNWNVHIQSLVKMMNLFAVSGHINYVKCSRLYVKEMISLSETNPWLHQQFENGCHSVRISGRSCAGLWSDLVIEGVEVVVKM